MNNIEGVPDGWRLVRIGEPKVGEWIVNGDGGATKYLVTVTNARRNHIVIERIELPKPKYRPFANSAEFEPNRDRWVFVRDNRMVTRPISYTYGGVYVGGVWRCWKESFEHLEFQDCAPFGVEVVEVVER